MMVCIHNTYIKSSKKNKNFFPHPRLTDYGETNFVVDRCTVINNRLGIIVSGGSNIVITNSSIIENMLGGVGSNGDSVTISRCIFRGDTGAGIIISANSPEIVNNLICNNTSDNAYAIKITGSSSPRIMNCTIAGHDGQNASGIQVVSNDGGTPELVNSILWDNADDIKLDDPDNGDTIDISYCNIEDGDGPANAGNISSEPDFRDTEMYRIKYSSPCRDYETDTAADVPVLDLYGNARPWDEGVDMGAHEYRLEITDVSYHWGSTEDTVSIEWDDEDNSLTCDVYYHDDMADTIGYWTLADTEQLSPWVDDNDVADSYARFYIINKH
jgi:Right handed beta helix region